MHVLRRYRKKIKRERKGSGRDEMTGGKVGGLKKGGTVGEHKKTGRKGKENENESACTAQV